MDHRPLFRRGSQSGLRAFFTPSIFPLSNDAFILTDPQTFSEHPAHFFVWPIASPSTGAHRQLASVAASYLFGHGQNAVTTALSWVTTYFRLR